MNLRIGSHISDQNERLSAFAWIMVVMCAVLVSVVQLGTMVSLLAGRVGFSSIFPISIGVALVMATVLICSLLLSRHLWWPRYGPQLWLLPIWPIAFAFQLRVSGYKLALARAILFLLIIDAGIVSCVRLQWEANASVILRQQLMQMRESGQVYEVQTNYFDDSWRIRLLEAGVRFQDVGMKELAGIQELMSVVEGFPVPIRYRMIPSVTSGP
jgi:hypothetical protein